MPLDSSSARGILERAHAAWSKQDLQGTLGCYHKEIAYSCNVGGTDGQRLEVVGKEAMRNFLEPILRVAVGHSAPLSFAFRDRIERANIQFRLRHLESGATLEGTFRQIAKITDGKIISLDELHDAARMHTLWNMVQGPAHPLGKNRPIISKLLNYALKQRPLADD